MSDLDVSRPPRAESVKYQYSCTQCSLNLQELDWLVLKLVLSKMPLLLQNKTLVLSAELDDIRKLCGRLCDMVIHAFYILTCLTLAESGIYATSKCNLYAHP